MSFITVIYNNDHDGNYDVCGDIEDDSVGGDGEDVDIGDDNDNAKNMAMTTTNKNNDDGDDDDGAAAADEDNDDDDDDNENDNDDNENDGENICQAPLIPISRVYHCYALKAQLMRQAKGVQKVFYMQRRESSLPVTGFYFFGSKVGQYNWVYVS
ncbi:hypothetical protein PoB_002888900 [Plakobranchus ocellatus]|uniref:Uncharacterized protein n=1 Tax=Plakobranchus ocellatus TaxID=259542 RepID=A0AAV4A835_9GAST|nr:hypothetical protein PoB_002888900 [Plakobranchus ocellatus]